MEKIMEKDKLILLVEDDKVDQMTVKRCLKENKSTHPLKVCNNGEEALEYLNNPESEIPGFIFLDLNMPRMNGIEFLKVAKADEKFRKIPVIVLTTSKEDQDRMETFNLSVAGYMIKPVDYSHFVDTIKTVQDYWGKSQLAFS